MLPIIIRFNVGLLLAIHAYSYAVGINRLSITGVYFIVNGCVCVEHLEYHTCSFVRMDVPSNLYNDRLVHGSLIIGTTFSAWELSLPLLQQSMLSSLRA